MNTNDVAERLGVAPRQLRQFLRSRESTYKAVGSGARYEFKERDVPEIERRYKRWAANGKRSENTRDRTPKTRTTTPRLTADERDRQVWIEEAEERAAAGLPPIRLPDIRDPRVRRRVLADARAQEDRLMMQLMAKGLHVTQMGDRR